MTAGGAAIVPPLLAARCVVLAAAVVLAAGCGGIGGSSSEDGVRETVGAYFTALADRNFAEACDRVSPDFKVGLAGFAKRAYPDLDSTECVPIARRIATAGGGRLVGLQRKVRVRSVEVEEDRARAQLGPGQVAVLRRIEGDWLIDELDFSATSSSPP
jgi:hypothetical protein